MLYVLFALNVFLAWTGLLYFSPAVAVALRVALGLGYAFAPFLLALLLAMLLTKSYAEPTAAVRNLEIMWSLTLTAAVLALSLSLQT